jgi:hypothetical protein
VYDFSLIFPTTDELVHHILRPLSSAKKVAIQEILPTSADSYQYVSMHSEVGDEDTFYNEDLLPYYTYKPRTDDQEGYFNEDVDEDVFTEEETF